MFSIDLLASIVVFLIVVATAALSFYFIRRTRLLSHALTELHQINQDVEHDAINFFRQSWRILYSVGVFRIATKIKWFGEEKAIQFGDVPLKNSVQIYHHLNHGEIAFDIVLDVSRNVSREKSLANLVLQTFLSLLERDMILKEDQVSSTQKRLERYQLFVQHEIKNIAQFIDLLSSQVERIEKDEDKIRLANRLKQTLPVMAQRAQKTIQTMKNPSLSQEEVMDFSVRSVVEEVINMYSLNCKVLGDADVSMRREILLEILKNILGNFRDHNVDSDLTVYLTDNSQPNQIEVQIHSRKISGVVLQPERMFEPFWTTSKSGLGLGLFLARELLKKIKGDVQFQQSGQHFGFTLTFPKGDN